VTLTDDSYCINWVLQLPGGYKIGGQVTQVVFKITVLEEYKKMNDLTGTLILASRVTAKASDHSLVGTVDGTYVWTHS
jgi:hypothetical protein